MSLLIYLTEILLRLFARALSTGKIPQHVAFIMDGNRTFARKNEKSSQWGHSKGFDAMNSVLHACYLSGIPCASVFAFSIENYKRSKKERLDLEMLAKRKLQEILEKGHLCDKYGVKIKIVGNLTYVSDDLLKVFKLVEERTRHNNKSILNVCWAYTARDDMVHSMRELVEKEQDARDENGIDIESFTKCLRSGDCPPVDLVVRTSGVKRLSDFFLWEITGGSTKIEMVDILWPQFNASVMLWILFKFAYGNL